MIEAQNLTKWYGRVRALHEVSLHVAPNTVVGLLGPNGAGKSTTMKILTCSLPASAGRASVAGFDVLTDSLEVRRRVGYMPEAVPLYAEMRAGEYLRFRAALRGIPWRRRRRAVERAAERCWLLKPQDVLRRRIGELSRGYRQRVGLAEAMLHEPPVLILDEPTAGLDPAQIRDTRQLIRQLKDGHTVILSSHILAEVEQTCDEAIIIAGGSVAASGSIQDLRRRVAGPSGVVAELQGAPADELRRQVAALPGVTGVVAEQAGRWHRLLVQSADGRDVRADIAGLAAGRGWPLRELRRQAGSLEDFFVQITYRQNMQQTAREA